MLKGESRFQFVPHSNNLAAVLVSEFTALCTNPKAPLVDGLAWVFGVSALGSALGAGSTVSGLIGVALALFAI
jgi:hypothetical protein